MSILRDLRYGARTLLKSPALIIVATIALGLGIGTTATVWSIVYGGMIKGLPFDEPQQIVAVFRTNPSKAVDRMGVTAHDYVDYRTQQRTFEKLGAITCGTINVSGTDRAERYDGCWMTVDAMAIPRVNPMRGRLFQPGEDAPGGERVAIISYAMWQGHFGGAENVIGRAIRVNGAPHAAWHRTHARPCSRGRRVAAPRYDHVRCAAPRPSDFRRSGCRPCNRGAARMLSAGAPCDGRGSARGAEKRLIAAGRRLTRVATAKLSIARSRTQHYARIGNP